MSQANTNTNTESLPFFHQLLENPSEFTLDNLNSVSGDKTDHMMHEQHEHDHVHDDQPKVFCGGMMNMNQHEMAQHGVASMHMSKGGMIMYMDGFRFAMAGNQPCLNLYFPSWTLDTPTKFLGGVLLVFLLAFGTEGVSKFRHTITSSQYPNLRHGRLVPSSRRARQVMISALHGFQALMGYVVMLATMTFSVEILMAVVLGLSMGYYYYFAGEVGLEGHVTTNPCCNFMQDESNEHEQQQQQQQQQLHAMADAGMTTGLLSLPSGSGQQEPF